MTNMEAISFRDIQRRIAVRIERQKGVALITALLVLILISAIVVGMSWMVMTDQRLGGNNESREIAFYGAEAGMEKMTTDVANQFALKGSLGAADVAAIEALVPTTLPGIQYVNGAGNSTYTMQFVPDATGNPKANNATILPPSPYAGMQGLITPFTLTVAAQNTSTGSEVKLQRQVQLVAIPVFQFGIFSNSDVAFFNGPPFGFGGRTHTNGNLWLSPNAGPLYLGDRVTAVGQVIRTNLENGYAVNGGNYTGNVTIATTPDPTLANEPTSAPYTNGTWLELLLNQGSTDPASTSVYGTISTIPNINWNTITGPYNGQLQNAVPPLNLTATALGGITTPISLIRRAIPGEAISNSAEFNEQYFSEASLRILLDDYLPGILPGSGAACHKSDMMGLGTEGVTTGTDPIDLATLAFPGPATPPTVSWYTGFPLPVSASGGAYSSADGYWVTNGSPIITGCLKIEYQAAGGGWTDVTKAILNQGVSGANINPLSAGAYQLPPAIVPLPNPSTNPAAIAAQGPTSNSNVTSKLTCSGSAATNPSPNAIIRLARLRDNPTTASPGGGCGTPSNLGEDYWPLALFDSREGVYRVTLPALPTSQDWGGTAPGVTAMGVMDYVELDVANLAAWLKANQVTLGVSNLDTGFTVYFSDRRGEQIDPASGTKTGSFGYNDFVNNINPASGCPNGTIDPPVLPGGPAMGEDLEGDGILRTYGGVAITPPNFVTGGTTLLGAGGLLTPNCGSTAWPGVIYSHTQEARENSPVYFRRALKLVDGATLNLGNSCGAVVCGLTIAAENPVYIQGDYNAPATGAFNGASVAAAVAADAVTLLSDNWNDVNSFMYPYALGTSGDRVAVQTAYRVALIAGKGIPFPQIGGACTCNDFGTDGGVHNFLRFLETWNGVNGYYYGSMVSFYYNRQGVGTYKNSGYVYSPPNRHYQFDTNFTLGPAYLPPRTPVLRSVNTIGFSQQLLPTQ
jgi:type IV pilus assembly PilX-like protein